MLVWTVKSVQQERGQINRQHSLSRRLDGVRLDEDGDADGEKDVDEEPKKAAFVESVFVYAFKFECKSMVLLNGKWKKLSEEEM